MGFSGGPVVKNLAANAGVLSLDWEDPPEKEMTTHSSILAWRIPWTEEPGGLQSMGLQESDRTEQLNTHTHTHTHSHMHSHAHAHIPHGLHTHLTQTPHRNIA